MLKRLQDVQSKNLPFLVATRKVDESGSSETNDSDAVIGYAYVNYHHTRSAWRFTVEDSIYIDPQFTRQGALLM